MGAVTYKIPVASGKVPDVQAGNGAQELEILSKLHSDGLINENDYERKKRELFELGRPGGGNRGGAHAS